MRVKLGELNRDLEGIIMIRGYGLTSNVYLILGRDIGLIDTGGGPPINLLLKDFKELGIQVARITNVILTHSHSDHVGGLKEVNLHSKLMIHTHPTALDSLNGFEKLISLVDGEVIKVGRLTLKVLFTPGHSADSICLYNPSLHFLFSGDTLFPNGNIGRTDLPTGNHSQLIRSLQTLALLPVRHLLPGHEDPVIGNGERHVKASLQTAETTFLGQI